MALFSHFAHTHNLMLLGSEMDDIERIILMHPEVMQLRKDVAEWQTAFAPFPAPPRALAEQAIANASIIKDLKSRGVIT